MKNRLLMKSYNIAVIGGDGTGPEVVREATQVVGLENHEWSVLLSFAPPELAV